MTLDWSVVQYGMQFCESWLCKLALVSLSSHPLFLFWNLLPLSPSLCLSIYLSIYIYLSLSRSWYLSLRRCIEKEKEMWKKWRKKKLFIHLIILFFLYVGTSGLHAHTHGHAWLGVVCCCWHVAAGMLYVAMVFSLFISVSQSPTSRCGLPSK